MNRGQIQQVDPPQALHWSPVNLFIVAFIGSPSMNLLDAVVADGSLRFAGFSLPLDELGDDARKLPSRVILGVRPEHLEQEGLIAADNRTGFTARLPSAVLQGHLGERAEIICWIASFGDCRSLAG